MAKGLRSLLSLNQQDYARPVFWQDINTRTLGFPLHVAKPGNTFILWLAGAIPGFEDFILPGVTAISALLGLILTFLIARKLGGLLSEIFATAFLASSVFYL